MKGQEGEQGQYSLIGQYWNGPWGFKVGYAANLESEVNGVEQKDDDEVLSAQLMYVKMVSYHTSVLASMMLMIQPTRKVSYV